MELLDKPYIKPVLNLSKQQISQYLKARNFDWREDSSNQETKYKRNAVRLDLIPVMAQLAGGRDALSRRLFALSEQSTALNQWINDEVGTLCCSWADIDLYISFIT